jgi:hypothetical protein
MSNGGRVSLVGGSQEMAERIRSWSANLADSTVACYDTLQRRGELAIVLRGSVYRDAWERQRAGLGRGGPSRVDSSCELRLQLQLCGKRHARTTDFAVGTEPMGREPRRLWKTKSSKET